jgi:hypothetical protein
MPVVLRANGYKFWFYEADLDEPPHVHAGKDGKVAKFWLDPVKMARGGRFRPIQLREIRRIVHENRAYLLNTWEREQSKRVDR